MFKAEKAVEAEYYNEDTAEDDEVVKEEEMVAPMT